MSTCSTATSALRGHESRGRRRRAPPPARGAGVVEAVHGRLERRLVDLERDWDAYRTGRSGAPRHHHRRSRSATGTPSSAVTVAAPEADGLLLPLYRCSSPRRLVSSLQRTTSADSDRAAKIILRAAGDSPTGPSSVCSVEAGYSMEASSSSCSCPRRCRCAVCCSSYSASSSLTGAAAPPFSSAAGGTAGERARKSDGGRWAAFPTAWIYAIAFVVVVFVAMVILELRVGDGCGEYLAPT
ncbi:hypothetical protein PAHAL_7G122500 [Panicum hallii]|jgi:hypothetical protein|uniref:Uncharacterized protein n=1 Tax=Panicum hallii TaxID=206008 RepID=A0A2T8IBY3_9POAL|nr:hypothetical protein PAHAL_7G122500 [Panicum hallii]